MITFINKHQKKLLIVVTILVIIAFAWLYNDTNLQQLDNSAAFQMYGKTVSQVEANRRARLYQLSLSLGFADLVQRLGGGVTGARDSAEAFVVNSIVLDHETEILGINPRADEVAEIVRTLPPFQTGGTFDLEKYASFIENSLAPFGLTEASLEEAVIQQIRFGKLRQLLNSSIAVSDQQAWEEYARGNRMLDLVVVRFPLQDVATGIEVTEDQIDAAYEARKEVLNTAPKRSVKWIDFALTEEQKKLAGKERIAVLQELANKAGSFAESMLEEGADFEKLAAEQNLGVKTSQPFSRPEPDPQFADSPAVTEAAMRLSEEDPNSDPVQHGEGFYILRLHEVIPSRPLTKEEARDRLIASIKEERAREAVEARVHEVRESLLQSLQAGKTIEEAGSEAGVQTEALPKMSLSQPDQAVPEVMPILRQTVELPQRGLSKPVSLSDGTALVYLRGWTDPAREDFESSKARIKQQLRFIRSEILFQEWLRNRRNASGVAS